MCYKSYIKDMLKLSISLEKKARPPEIAILLVNGGPISCVLLKIDLFAGNRSVKFLAAHDTQESLISLTLCGNVFLRCKTCTPYDSANHYARPTNDYPTPCCNFIRHENIGKFSAKNIFRGIKVLHRQTRRE